MRGIKALPFLEYYKEVKDNVTNQQLNKIADFYLQPFNPIDIPKIFAGWKQYSDIHGQKKTKWHSEKFNNDKQYYYEYEEGLYGNEVGYIVEESLVLKTKKPMILNVFIQDCRNSNIELIFNPNFAKGIII